MAVDPQIQNFIRSMSPWFALIVVLGIVVTFIERKADDYAWGKRYERRKKIKEKIDNKLKKK